MARALREGLIFLRRNAPLSRTHLQNLCDAIVAAKAIIDSTESRTATAPGPAGRAQAARTGATAVKSRPLPLAQPQALSSRATTAATATPNRRVTVANLQRLATGSSAASVAPSKLESIGDFSHAGGSSSSAPESTGLIHVFYLPTTSWKYDELNICVGPDGIFPRNIGEGHLGVPDLCTTGQLLKVR